MTMQKRFKVEHGDAFPLGALVKGQVRKVEDFKQDPTGVDVNGRKIRPQQLDKDTGLPLWEVLVVDLDEEAGKKETAISVKIAARVQPMLPKSDVAIPGLTAVEFVGLTALPYVEYGDTKDDQGRPRTRIVWSFKAKDMAEVGTARKQAAGKPSGAEKPAA